VWARVPPPLLASSLQQSTFLTCGGQLPASSFIGDSSPHATVVVPGGRSRSLARLALWPPGSLCVYDHVLGAVVWTQRTIKDAMKSSRLIRRDSASSISMRPGKGLDTPHATLS
jgi:hypothetical protein